jgi:trehalose 6-phosphate synthase
MNFTRRDLAAYRRVNAVLADALAPLLSPSDLVWVHDYHLIPMAEELRRAGATQRIGGFFRLSRVALVTPLRDGMNLVAKEYVAAQNPDDPGVLVLSPFAGAAYELDTAVIANPYDPDAVAEALQTALGMPLGERCERWRAMMVVLRRNSIAAWRESFLGALSS